MTATEFFASPVVLGVIASVVFGLIKRTGWLDCTRDEVRFVLAVLFAGIIGASTVQEPHGAWPYVVAFGRAAGTAVFAYQGWKQIVRRWLGRLVGYPVDLTELEEAEAKVQSEQEVR